MELLIILVAFLGLLAVTFLGAKGDDSLRDTFGVIAGVLAVIVTWQACETRSDAREYDLPSSHSTAVLGVYAAEARRHAAVAVVPTVHVSSEDVCVVCCAGNDTFACLDCARLGTLCCEPRPRPEPGCWRCCRYDAGLLVPYSPETRP